MSDYNSPNEHSSAHSSHRHHRHHGSRSGDGAREASLHRRKVVAAVVGIAIVIAAAFFAVRMWENGAFEISEPGESHVHTKAVIEPTKTMLIDGNDYVQRRSVLTYLFMGVDVLDGSAVGTKEYNGGGQADFLALVVVDKEANTWRIVHINRDTMTDVPVLNFTGRVIGYDNAQIALAYAYGDDEFSGCTNTARTVSALFGDQDIDGYISIQMDGIAVLNDAVGGVEVEVLSDFSNVDASLVQGATVTLDGLQAIEYVRSRYGVDDETNLARMQRQRQFMSAFLEQASGLTDRGIVDVYDAISQWSYTNMGSGAFVDLADYMDKYEQLPTVELAGENVVGERFMEYRLDEEALRRTTAELFYEIAE